jgi:SAM-dependent methyltransferase
LATRPRRILDLACGPGFYTSRLASLGHACTGIDYSPASIEYASAQAIADDLACVYACRDLRRASFGEGHDLVMLISGELNIFRPEHAAAILGKSHAALGEDGLLLLEVHTEQSVRDIASRGLRWYSAERSVFSDAAHICLQEHRWDESTRTSTVRYFVLHAGNTTVDRYAQTYQAYSREAYRSLIERAGFGHIEWHASLTGAVDESQKAFEVIVASTASA